MENEGVDRTILCVVSLVLGLSLPACGGGGDSGGVSGQNYEGDAGQNYKRDDTASDSDARSSPPDSSTDNPDGGTEGVGNLSTVKFKGIDSDQLYNCGITVDDRVRCWGRTTADAKPGGELADIVIAPGFASYCVLTESGSIKGCSGLAPEDGAWDGSVTYRTIAAGDPAICAIDSEDKLSCWNTASETQVPQGRFADVAVGDEFGCAVKEQDGALTCWGANDFGQAEPPSGTFRTVYASDSLACALDDNNHLNCWGDPDDGSTQPPDGNISDAVSLAGAVHCAIAEEGGIQCWGGSIGNEQAIFDHPEQTNFTDISVGAVGCALQEDQYVRCWGDEDNSNMTTPP